MSSRWLPPVSKPTHFDQSRSSRSSLPSQTSFWPIALRSLTVAAICAHVGLSVNTGFLLLGAVSALASGKRQALLRPCSELFGQRLDLVAVAEALIDQRA